MAKTTTRIQVDPTMRIDSIRVPFERLKGLLDEQPTSDRLRAPALAAHGAVGQCLTVVEMVRSTSDKVIQRQEHSIGHVAEAAAAERVRGQSFMIAEDERREKQRYIQELQQQAAKRLRADVGKKFADAAEKASKRAVETMQQYDTAIKRAKVVAEAPSVNLTADQMRKLEFESKQFQRWEPERMRDWAADMLFLSATNEQERLRLRLLISDFTHNYRRTPAAEHARGRSRASAEQSAQAAIRALDRIAEALARADYPEWIPLHDEQFQPLLQRLFKVTCGVDARQLSRAEYSRFYLTDGFRLDPLSVWSDWPLRYCDDDRIVAAGRMFELDLVAATDTAVNRQRQASKPKPKPKAKASTREERIRARNQRVAEHKARMAARDRPQLSGGGRTVIPGEFLGGSRKGG